MARSPKRTLRNSSFSIWLLVIAWVLYLISLNLPAITITTDFPMKPRDGFVPGGEVLGMLVLSLMLVLSSTLLLVEPFAYFLVNVLFLISPFMLWGRRFSGSVYAVFLGLSVIAAWSSPLCVMVGDFSYGYFVWSISLTTAFVAFCLPMKRHSTPEPVDSSVANSIEGE